MLRISIQEQTNSVVLHVEGSLRGPWVAELERVWQRKRGPERRVCLHLEDVTYVDDGARALLRCMYEDGVELLAAGPMMTAVVEEVAQNCGHDVASGEKHSRRVNTTRYLAEGRNKQEV